MNLQLTKEELQRLKRERAIKEKKLKDKRTIRKYV